MKTKTVKEDVRELSESLSEGCTWEDVMYQVYVRQRVSEGLDAVAQGRLVSHDEAKRRISEWLKSFGPTPP